MTEIGGTLREARMRAGIDITEVERVTKIRTKYLRALEDEEWGVLPGATFVKSFLRTYADYLGLDSRLLVEEFKRRYEKPEAELPSLGPSRRERRRGGEPRRLGPPLLVGAVIVAVIAALLALGTIGKKKGTTSPTSTSHAKRHHRHRAHRPAVRNRFGGPSGLVRLQVVPTGPVYVCLVDGAGRKLIPGQTLATGQPTRTFAARRLLLTVGNAAVRLRLGDREVPVPPSSRPISYVITAAGRKVLPAGQAPSCA